MVKQELKYNVAQCIKCHEQHTQADMLRDSQDNLYYMCNRTRKLVQINDFAYSTADGCITLKPIVEHRLSDLMKVAALKVAQRKSIAHLIPKKKGSYRFMTNNKTTIHI